MNHEIYADHAATTPIEPLALEAMYTAYQEYAKPRRTLPQRPAHQAERGKKARLTVAENLGCNPRSYSFSPPAAARAIPGPSVARCRRAAMWSQRPSSTTRF